MLKLEAKASNYKPMWRSMLACQLDFYNLKKDGYVSMIWSKRKGNNSKESSLVQLKMISMQKNKRKI